MIDFEYQNPAKIIFGLNPYEKVAEIMKSKKVTSLLLIYSGEFIKDLGIYQEIEEILQQAGDLFYGEWKRCSKSESRVSPGADPDRQRKKGGFHSCCGRNRQFF